MQVGPDGTAEELHKRTLVRRIKEHYTGHFGTGWGTSMHTNGLLSLGDPLSAFRPTPFLRASAFHKPQAGHRVTVKSKTFSYYTRRPWIGSEDSAAGGELKQVSSVPDDGEVHTAAPQSSTAAESLLGDNKKLRKTSAGELAYTVDDTILHQASLQRRPATAAPALGIPSAHAPETSILHDAENGNAAAKETVVRVLLSSFMKPEAVLSSGVLVTDHKRKTLQSV